MAVWSIHGAMLFRNERIKYKYDSVTTPFFNSVMFEERYHMLQKFICFVNSGILMNILKPEGCSKYSLFFNISGQNLERFTYHKETLLWVNLCLGDLIICLHPIEMQAVGKVVPSMEFYNIHWLYNTVTNFWMNHHFKHCSRAG
jgi:hypothetical protein